MKILSTTDFPEGNLYLFDSIWIYFVSWSNKNASDQYGSTEAELKVPPPKVETRIF